MIRAPIPESFPPTGAKEALPREPQWYACRTRARAEKQVDRWLARAGFTVHLPLVSLERVWADRKKRVAFPLFPGYTFAQFTMDSFLEVIRTPGLVEVVGGRGAAYPGARRRTRGRSASCVRP